MIFKKPSYDPFKQQIKTYKNLTIPKLLNRSVLLLLTKTIKNNFGNWNEAEMKERN